MGAGIYGALIGAGLGAAQYKSDQEQEARDRQLAASLMRTSPWTGMKPNPNIAHHTMLGNIEQGALGGATFGLQDAFKGPSALDTAKQKYYESQTPGAAPAGAPASEDDGASLTDNPTSNATPKTPQTPKPVVPGATRQGPMRPLAAQAPQVPWMGMQQGRGDTYTG